MISEHDNPSIVYLDGYTLNPGDLDWSSLTDLGDVKIYDRSNGDEIVDRAKAAEIVLVNKAELTAERIEQLPNLKYIGVTATGYNIVDLEAASECNIPVCNAANYSTPGVAQHVFALLLELTNRVGDHDKSVQNGDWASSADFAYTLQTLPELAEKTMGIYGLGNIGNKVADIALAFDMKVISLHKHPKRDARPGVEFVDKDTLLRESDVLSLHAPLSEKNKYFINAESLKMMKPTAYLINTGRGGLVHEADLRAALLAGEIKGAGVDVLSKEPPPADHPLFGLPNCIITPHVAWATKESRERLLEICVENIKAFLKGEPRNVVNEIA
ncbi:MAG: D-2-hydroxyacid dehydrogenase [Bacteroidota bacterium]